MEHPRRAISRPMNEGPTDTPAARILVVDDDPQVRLLLKKLLEGAGYEVEEFGTAESALERIRAGVADLVFLDLQLPDRSGHSVLGEIRSNPATRLLPVVMLTGFASSGEKVRAYEEGVTDFLAKPFAPDELLPRVRSLVLLKQFADEHEHTGRVILTLARTIDARDPYTAGHSGRVAGYAELIASRLGIDDGARREMRRGALFHDLGKIVVPDAVLRKPGPLTAEERAIIQKHPVVGRDLLAPMRTMSKTLPFVYSHHERLDGSGYPDGVLADDLPLTVRIVTIADIFDALTTDRPYRSALTHAAAYEILGDGVRSGWWDGDVLRELRAAIADLPGSALGTGVLLTAEVNAD
jgi:putative two-component system response regulator